MRTLRSGAVAFAGAAALSLTVARLHAERGSGLDLAVLLDLYAAGRYDEAISAVERASNDDGIAMRLWWFADGRRWIDANPAEHRRRLLVAAAFALEVEQVRVERGQWQRGPWQKTSKNGLSGRTCAGKCVLDWAAECLLERGEPDEAERAWWLAAIALAQGVRDTGALYVASPGVPSRIATIAKLQPLPPKPPAGLVVFALARFPDDARFKLARVMAQAAGYDVTVDGGPRSPAVNDDITRQTGSMSTSTTVSQGDLRSSITVRSSGVRVPVAPATPWVLEANRRRYAERERVIADLTALAADPVVGIEARLRLGYLYWATGDDARARAELAATAAAAVDPDLRYLARFLSGVAARSADDTDAAVAALTAALETRPNGQSAALALAAIELQRGNGGRAYDLAQRTLDAGGGDADPWRLFLYGHYPQWAALRASLRELVAR